MLAEYGRPVLQLNLTDRTAGLAGLAELARKLTELELDRR